MLPAAQPRTRRRCRSRACPMTPVPGISHGGTRSACDASASRGAAPASSAGDERVSECNRASAIQGRRFAVRRVWPRADRIICVPREARLSHIAGTESSSRRLSPRANRRRALLRASWNRRGIARVIAIRPGARQDAARCTTPDASLACGHTRRALCYRLESRDRRRAHRRARHSSHCPTAGGGPKAGRVLVCTTQLVTRASSRRRGRAKHGPETGRAR